MVGAENNYTSREPKRIRQRATYSQEVETATVMIEGDTVEDIEQVTAESIIHITMEVVEPQWKTTIIATIVGVIDGEPTVAVAGSIAQVEVVEKAVGMQVVSI